MNVSENLLRVKNDLPGDCTLVAVSKTKPVEMILDAHQTGQLDFGENKVQELVSKHETLPKEIRWHMIGHLQRNKVKYIAPFIHLIHGVDSLRLLREIHKQGVKNDRVINCLLQVHIARETTKFGFSYEELDALLSDGTLDDLTHVQIQGLMGMASNTRDETLVKSEFSNLKSKFDLISNQSNLHNVQMDTLSIGMSNDYQLAITCGGNMIRIGSLIFGERHY